MLERIPVIGIGAGGHAKVVIDILKLGRRYDVVGLLDPRAELHGGAVMGVNVLGDDLLLESLLARGIRHVFIGVGSTASAGPRERLYRELRGRGFAVVSAVHPRAVVSGAAVVGDGVTIGPGAIVNAAARLGENVIINSGAIVEHDCVVGDHAHIATGAHLASTVTVGRGAHVGVGAAVRQCIRIGDGAVVGAGAAVVADVPDATVVVGVPARILRRAVR